MCNFPQWQIEYIHHFCHFPKVLMEMCTLAFFQIASTGPHQNLGGSFMYVWSFKHKKSRKTLPKKTWSKALSMQDGGPSLCLDSPCGGLLGPPPLPLGKISHPKRESSECLKRKNNKEAITGPRSPGLPGTGRSDSFIFLFIWKLRLTLMVRNTVTSRSLSWHKWSLGALSLNRH